MEFDGNLRLLLASGHHSSCSEPQPSSCSIGHLLHDGARRHLSRPPIHHHTGRDPLEQMRQWPASGRRHKPVPHVLAVPGLSLVGRWRVRVRPKEGATTPRVFCVFTERRMSCTVATFWDVVKASLKVACILQTESSHTLRFFGKPRSQT